MTKLYLFCRKIHRYIALAATALLSLMAGTGMMLSAPKIADALPWIDIKYARSIHGAMAPWAGLSVWLMLLTGLVLYLYPLWMRKNAPPPTTNGIN
ncbi:hypothetical protein HY949_03080 [Candidatus Gottesmanbacteria bacterium]|nr:hypothetical protein [Candidatus Gottesmanbacteria bacterium]